MAEDSYDFVMSSICFSKPCYKSLKDGDVDESALLIEMVYCTKCAGLAVYQELLCCS